MSHPRFRFRFSLALSLSVENFALLAFRDQVNLPACSYALRIWGLWAVSGAGKDCRHYMPRVTAACVAAASSQTGSASAGNSSGAAATNAAVIFDRTMQNVVDKLFPHFAVQERLEEEELRRYMQQHQHKQLPPEYALEGLASGPPGGPFRREALAQRRARLEARLAAEEALGPPPLSPPPISQHQQQTPDDKAAATQKHMPREGTRSSSRRSAQLQQQQQPSLDEFVDHLLETPSCFDEQQTTAIALLPDTYQGQLMKARVRHQAAQQSQDRAVASAVSPQVNDLVCLPFELPQLDRPYLRVPSRMSVQLVLRYLATQLQPLLFPGGRSVASSFKGNAEAHATSAGGRADHSGLAGVMDDQIDLETTLELTLEGRVLGRSHSIDFVRRARRLNCAGKCLLLQYRYTAQTETRVVAYHLARLDQCPRASPDALSPARDIETTRPH